VNITYRTAAADDYDFLYRLHRDTMRPYVEATWGDWIEDWQQENFRLHFNPALLRVIQLQGLDVGVMQAQDRTEELFLVRLEILPEYQKRGIGTRVIEDLVAEAARQGKPAALQVLKVNFPARSLYQRLGFGVTGENDTHYIMAYESRTKIG
jgi:ribosomal protein S18 acetylase RimI-like enzyme